MLRNITIKIASILLLSSGLLMTSCEPPLCAYCYDRQGWIDLDGRDIEICADDQFELDELVWLSEDMGYECEYQ